MPALVGEGRREFAELAPDNAAMPGGLTLALAGLPVLPAALGGQRKHRKGCVAAGGFDFGVFAEEGGPSAPSDRRVCGRRTPEVRSPRGGAAPAVTNPDAGAA
jgi:hypothetical protein